VASQADCAVQLNAARETITTQQATIAAGITANAAITARLKALEAGGSGIGLWTPATVLQPNTPYILPTGVAVKIDVKVPGVTLIGGLVWPEPNGPMSAITANVGGDDLTIVGTRISWEDAPADLVAVPLKPGFRTYARNAALRGVKFGALAQCVEAMTPCDGLAMDYCEADGRVRSAFVYVGGGKGVSLLRCKAVDSWKENLVRCSPQNGVVPDGFTVTECDLQQLGSKAVIELRSVSNATVQRSVLRAAVGHTALSCGREDPNAGPGSSNVRFFDSVCYQGRLEIDPASSDVSFENVRLYGLRYGTTNTSEARKLYDVGVTVNGTFGQMKNVRLRNVVGVIGGDTVKPFVSYTAKDQIVGLDDDGSSKWVVQPPPVTVPGGAGRP
jgi:hypothetical protein